MKNIPDPDNMSADSKPWSIGTEFPQVFPTQTDPGKAMCAVPNTSVWVGPSQVEEVHTHHTHREAPVQAAGCGRSAHLLETHGPWLESVCSAVCP